jgi:cation:H+ antiporter
MFLAGIFSSFPLVLLLFLASSVTVIAASARFTRQLEALCEVFQLSIGILSLLSALGANIPNYVSSSLAILDRHVDVGIGIIIGSNIYNIAITLALCTLLTTTSSGIILQPQARRDVRVIAWYALIITLGACLVIALLPGRTLMALPHATGHIDLLALPIQVLVLLIFGGFIVHTLRRSHGSAGTTLAHHDHEDLKTPLSVVRLSAEIIFTLAIALGGVLVMVQSGQTLTDDLHMPSVLAGLLVLAIATSLPNTVVAISLVRTGEAAACVEEICSSGSINIALGIVLPLLFWPGILTDRFLLLLDGPLLLLLALAVLLCLFKGRMSRSLGILLFCTYIVWVLIRFWL